MTQGEQEKLRSILHDLSNVMTGVLMSGGLLRLALRGDTREHHAEDVCESGEKGAALVREARSLVPPPIETLGNVEGAEGQREKRPRPGRGMMAKDSAKSCRTV